jgi:hypothetical protein
LRIKEGRRENTFAGLRCCLNLYAVKTEEKGIAVLFILVKTSRKLSENLNRKLSDITLLQWLSE